MKTESDNWQIMQNIVKQYAAILPSKTYLTPQQFNQLRTKRLFSDNFLVFLMVYIGLKLSIFSATPSPLWLATGSACGYLFLRGTSVLPGIWLGSLFGFYFEKIGLRLVFECATVLTFQPLLLLQFCYRYLSPTLIFTHQRMFVKYILFTALLSAITSLMFVEICYSTLLHNESFFQCWVTWWLANLNSIIIFSCAMITWDAYASSAPGIKQWRTICIVFTTLSVLIVALAFSHTLILSTCLAFFVFLMTVFISVHFGWCGAIAAVFLSGILLSFAGLLNAPVFAIYTSAMSLFLIQLFLFLISIIGLSVANWDGDNGFNL